MDVGLGSVGHPGRLVRRSRRSSLGTNINNGPSAPNRSGGVAYSAATTIRPSERPSRSRRHAVQRLHEGEKSSFTGGGLKGERKDVWVGVADHPHGSVRPSGSWPHHLHHPPQHPHHHQTRLVAADGRRGRGRSMMMWGKKQGRNDEHQWSSFPSYSTLKASLQLLSSSSLLLRLLPSVFPASLRGFLYEEHRFPPSSANRRRPTSLRPDGSSSFRSHQSLGF